MVNIDTGISLQTRVAHRIAELRRLIAKGERQIELMKDELSQAIGIYEQLGPVAPLDDAPPKPAGYIDLIVRFLENHAGVHSGLQIDRGVLSEFGVEIGKATIYTQLRRATEKGRIVRVKDGWSATTEAERSHK